MKLKITASMLVLLGLVGCGGGGDGGDTADTTTGGGATTGGTTTGGTTTGGGTTNVTMASRLSTTGGRSIGLKADGTVLAWGDGDGVSIPGTPVAGTAAKQVSGLPAIAAVSVTNVFSAISANYGLALSADGRVFGWGKGALPGFTFGVYYKSVYSEPTQIDQLTGIRQIKATPAGFTVAAKSDGTLWVLGGPANGSVIGASKISAKQVAGVSGIVYISGGPSGNGVSTDSVSVVDDVGRVYIVDVKQLFSGGLGMDFAETSVEQVNGLPAISKVSCTAGGSARTYHCLALAVDGKVWSWGTDGEFGQIGDGGTSGRTIPVLLSGISGIVDVAAIDNNSFAVNGNGRVYSWGRYSYLGWDSKNVSALTPVDVPGVSDVVEIAAGSGVGGTTILVRTSGGSVWGWGDNKKGELGDGSTQAANKPVQAVGINLN